LVISISGLCKRYPGSEVDVLKGIDLEIESGDFVSLVGRSGCGKSTLLAIVGGLDSGYEGKVLVESHDLSSLGDGDLARYRRDSVGFVFQAYHLLDHLSCAENVALAARFGSGSTSGTTDERRRAVEVLDLVGLPGAADRRPTRLSGGERQRVAIARALFNRPTLLLLDEPTGNLDTATGTEILGLLSTLHRDLGMTILAATHDRAIETAGRRLLRMSDGVLVESTEDAP
jgi:putative ABC transport system ATP-binding protein